MPMLELQADRCTGCGLCVADCPRKILELREGRPVLAPEREASCFRCLHCFAVCPGGAISIHGNHPEASRPLAGSFPDPEALETLVQGRRSVRRYRDENLDPALVQRLLDVAIQAPTAVNARSVRFTVIDDREVMAAFQMCDDLVSQMVPYCQRKLATYEGNQDATVKATLKGLLAKRWCTDAQCVWIMRRAVDELQWTVGDGTLQSDQPDTV